MLLVMQIALGIWIGGILLAATGALYFVMAEKIERNKRRGYPWWSGLLRT